MTDLEFMDRAELVLKAIESGCDRINEQTTADIDNQRVGAMVTLVFPAGSQLVVNLQKPLQEIWLASPNGGYHFRFDGRHWMDTKGQGEFFQHLSREAGLQCGQPLVFAALPVVPE